VGKPDRWPSRSTRRTARYWRSRRVERNSHCAVPTSRRAAVGPVVLDLQRLGVDRLQPGQLRHARLDGREYARPPILLLLHATATVRSRRAAIALALQRMPAHSSATRSSRAEPSRAELSRAEISRGRCVAGARPQGPGSAGTTLQHAVPYCLCGTGPSASQIEQLCLQEDRQRSARLGVDGAVVRRRVRDAERLVLQLRKPLELLGLPAHPAVQRESRRAHHRAGWDATHAPALLPSTRRMPTHRSAHMTAVRSIGAQKPSMRERAVRAHARACRA
jgi:hypothetical protein